MASAASRVHPQTRVHISAREKEHRRGSMDSSSFERADAPDEPSAAAVADVAAVALRPCFTEATFRTFCALGGGFRAQTGRCTVCGMLVEHLFHRSFLQLRRIPLLSGFLFCHVPSLLPRNRASRKPRPIQGSAITNIEAQIA